MNNLEELRQTEEATNKIVNLLTVKTLSDISCEVAAMHLLIEDKERLSNAVGSIDYKAAFVSGLLMNAASNMLRKASDAIIDKALEGVVLIDMDEITEICSSTFKDYWQEAGQPMILSNAKKLYGTEARKGEQENETAKATE